MNSNIVTSLGPAAAPDREKLRIFFVSSTDQTVWTASTTAEEFPAWTGLKSLGSVVTTSNPVAAATGKDIVFRSLDSGSDPDQLWVSYETPPAVSNFAGGETYPPPPRSRNNQVLPPSINSGAAPGATIWNNMMYVVYRGSGIDSSLWMTSTTDPSNWPAPTQLQPMQQTTRGPAVALWKNKLWVLYVAASDGTLQITSTPATIGWSTPSQVGPSPITTPTRPSLVASNTALFAIYKGQADNGIYITSSRDGVTWTASQAVHAAATTDAPFAATIWMNQLVIIFKTDSDNPGSLWVISSQDGKSWYNPPLEINTVEGPVYLIATPDPATGGGAI